MISGHTDFARAPLASCAGRLGSTGLGTMRNEKMSSGEMLGRYASKTHAVGARLETDGRMSVLAPFGLDDIFSFRIVPNPVLPNRPAHEAKGARAKSVWPEITVVPWPE